jgi:hypothetical protein
MLSPPMATERVPKFIGFATLPPTASVRRSVCSTNRSAKAFAERRVGYDVLATGERRAPSRSDAGLAMF